MQWSKHGNNHQWVRPDSFPIAIWINKRGDPTSAPFGLCIYMATKLIKQEAHLSFAAAEAAAIAFLEDLKQQIQELLS